MLSTQRFPTKLFEIRDRATFMPVMAVRLLVVADCATEPDLAENWLLRRAGYAPDQITRTNEEPYVILILLDGGGAEYDPFSWRRGARTVPVAHQYIIENWDQLESGQVIDVQFISGETPTAKISERLTEGY